MRRVANSMCSLEKNECFCKPGYVSIQESYGITCKTLLTNLKCQVDSDCIHVVNSACHPGAGYCACPGGTIYVSQDNACRQSAENNQNPFCLKCRQANGVCYHYSSNQISNSNEVKRYKRYEYKDHKLIPFNSPVDVIFKEILQYSENTETYGCSCPHNTGMLVSFSMNDITTSINHSHLQKLHHTTSFNKLDENISLSTYQLVPHQFPQWYFCKAIMVDLWEYCNNVDLLCRAKNARCIRTDNELDLIQFTCQCIPGYIPVYQNHLEYHECFRQLEANHSSCSSCIHSNGKCYTMNKQDIESSIGCLCPNNLQSIITSSTQTNLIQHTNNNNNNNNNPIDSNNDEIINNNDNDNHLQNHYKSMLSQTTIMEYEVCGENLVHVYCQRHLLEICFLPMNQSPYENLAENLQLHHSIAFITNLTIYQKLINTCILNIKNSGLYHKQWNNTILNYNKFNTKHIWCKTIDWRQESTNIPCGLSITEYMTGDLYTGYLAIITNQEYRNHEVDFLFQFTCKTNNDVPHRVPGQVFERNIKVNRQDLLDDSPWPKLDVKFTVKDENGQSVQTILEPTPIRFEAELIDELNVYKAITIEECYMIDRIKSGQRNEDSKETLLLYKGCPMFKSNLNNQSIIGFNFQMNQYDNEKVFIFQPNNHNNNLYQLQTGLFHLYLNKQSIIDLDITQSINKTIKMIKPNMEKINTNKINKNVTMINNKSMKLINKPMNLLDDIYKEKLNEIGYRIHELKFTCIFRICKQLAWCSWPSACDSTISSLNNPRITFLPPSLRIIQRSIPLYLIESIPSSQLPVKKQVTSRICGELYCSNTLHILLMMSLIGILTCLMGLMGMLLARKYRHHLNQTRNSLIQSKSITIKQNHCIETDKNYYNPIKQSSISQYIIHKPQCQSDQQIDNEIFKSLLTVDNHITNNNNNNTSSVSNTSSSSNSNSNSSNNNNQPYTMDIKDCCKYWLNEHSYANPLLLQRSLPDDLTLHQHHHHHLHPQQQQQQQQQPYQQHQLYHSQCQQHQQPSQYELQPYQISPSSTMATPSHCSCLNETLFTDNKIIQNLSNYYTLKGYTTLPITTSNTFTSFKSIENSRQNDDYPLLNRTTTAFILEPTHTMISSINSSNTTTATTTTSTITTISNNDTHNYGNNNNMSISTMSNIHESITSSYSTTNISSNNNNSVIYCSDQLTDSYPHSSIQLQDDVILFQNNNNNNNNSTNELNNNQWGTIKNVQFVNNKSNHLSLQSQYKKLSTFDDTIYFGIDYHNPNCTINPVIETIQLDTNELQHNQIQSQFIQQSLK
ncbi:unnamed protein product [Schistosoma curassoni]|nr:unnamed protein product [Schistosoma curassoni]